ncbi:MAG: hypothetical protein OEX81_03940 [Candidatus Pacebacteria bacterium]|nr:hypothetical protein [Candidatus Paceibacterota bacterium]
MSKEKRGSFIEKLRGRLNLFSRDRQGRDRQGNDDQTLSLDGQNTNRPNITTDSSDEIVEKVFDKMSEEKRRPDLLKDTKFLVDLAKKTLKGGDIYANYDVTHSIDSEGVLTIVGIEREINRAQGKIEGVYRFTYVIKPEQDPARPRKLLYDDQEIIFQHEKQLHEPEFVPLDSL